MQSQNNHTSQDDLWRKFQERAGLTPAAPINLTNQYVAVFRGRTQSNLPVPAKYVATANGALQLVKIPTGEELTLLTPMHACDRRGEWFVLEQFALAQTFLKTLEATRDSFAFLRATNAVQLRADPLGEIPEIPVRVRGYLAERERFIDPTKDTLVPRALWLTEQNPEYIRAEQEREAQQLEQKSDSLQSCPAWYVLKKRWNHYALSGFHSYWLREVTGQMLLFCYCLGIMLGGFFADDVCRFAARFIIPQMVKNEYEWQCGQKFVFRADTETLAKWLHSAYRQTRQWYPKEPPGPVLSVMADLLLCLLDNETEQLDERVFSSLFTRALPVEARTSFSPLALPQPGVTKPAKRKEAGIQNLVPAGNAGSGYLSGYAKVYPQDNIYHHPFRSEIVLDCCYTGVRSGRVLEVEVTRGGEMFACISENRWKQLPGQCAFRDFDEAVGEDIYFVPTAISYAGAVFVFAHLLTYSEGNDAYFGRDVLFDEREKGKQPGVMQSLLHPGLLEEAAAVAERQHRALIACGLATPCTQAEEQIVREWQRETNLHRQKMQALMKAEREQRRTPFTGGFTPPFPDSRDEKLRSDWEDWEYWYRDAEERRELARADFALWNRRVADSSAPLLYQQAINSSFDPFDYSHSPPVMPVTLAGSDLQQALSLFAFVDPTCEYTLIPKSLAEMLSISDPLGVGWEHQGYEKLGKRVGCSYYTPTGTYESGAKKWIRSFASASGIVTQVWIGFGGTYYHLPVVVDQSVGSPILGFRGFFDRFLVGFPIDMQGQTRVLIKERPSSTPEKRERIAPSLVTRPQEQTPLFLWHFRVEKVPPFETTENYLTVPIVNAAGKVVFVDIFGRQKAGENGEKKPGEVERVELIPSQTQSDRWYPTSPYALCVETKEGLRAELVGVLTPQFCTGWPRPDLSGTYNTDEIVHLSRQLKRPGEYILRREQARGSYPWYYLCLTDLNNPQAILIDQAEADAMHLYTEFKNQVLQGRERTKSIRVRLALALQIEELCDLSQVIDACRILFQLFREEEMASPRHRCAGDGLPLFSLVSRPIALNHSPSMRHHYRDDLLQRYAEDEEIMEVLAPYWGAAFEAGSVYASCSLSEVGIPVETDVPYTSDRAVTFRFGDNYLPYFMQPGDEALVLLELLEMAETIWHSGKERAAITLPERYIVGKSVAEVQASLAQLLTIFEKRAVLERARTAEIEISAGDIRAVVLGGSPHRHLHSPKTNI